MHAECAGWLGRWDFHRGSDLDVGLLTREQLRDLMAQSYRAGYEDGRQKPPGTAK